MSPWFILAAAFLVIFLLVGLDIWMRFLARAYLREMSKTVTWTAPTDVKIDLYGGPYDAEARGDFD